MAYALEQAEIIPIGIKRIATELVDSILAQLKDETNNRDTAIYESRKHFKQLRALLRFVRSEIGEKFYQTANAFYRNLAQELAPLRDAYIVIEVLDKVLKDVEDVELQKTGKAVRKDLMKAYKLVRKDLLKPDGAVQKVIAELEAHRPSIETWPLKGKKFKVIAGNLERIYTQGKKQMKLAYKKNVSEEAFHEWRKFVKDLWYQMRLLENSETEKLSPYAKELKKLSDYLGDANDLSVLEAFLAKQTAWQGAAGQALLEQFRQKQSELLAAAKPLGAELYEEKPPKFIKHIRVYWKKWRSIKA